MEQHGHVQHPQKRNRGPNLLGKIIDRFTIIVIAWGIRSDTRAISATSIGEINEDRRFVKSQHRATMPESSEARESESDISVGNKGLSSVSSQPWTLQKDMANN